MAITQRVVLLLEKSYVKVYLPTLKEDTSKFARSCDKCQRYTNFVNSPAASLTYLVSPWPFAMWRIDLIIEHS